MLLASIQCFQVGQIQAEFLIVPANHDKWYGDGYTAAERRILLTHWVGAAVEIVDQRDTTLTRYFEKTGCMMTADGSGDHLIGADGAESHLLYICIS